MNAQKTKGDSILKEMLSASMTKIMFDRPDTNFIELTDASGYTHEKIKATIKATILPGDYASAEKEFRNVKSENDLKNLDTIHHFVNNKAAFSLIQEWISPSSDYENYISITTIIPNSSTISYVVIGAYPKSHDKALRKKFIASALSLMK